WAKSADVGDVGSGKAEVPPPHWSARGVFFGSFARTTFALSQSKERNAKRQHIQYPYGSPCSSGDCRNSAARDLSSPCRDALRQPFAWAVKHMANSLRQLRRQKGLL